MKHIKKLIIDGTNRVTVKDPLKTKIFKESFSVIERIFIDSKPGEEVTTVIDRGYGKHYGKHYGKSL